VASIREQCLLKIQQQASQFQGSECTKRPATLVRTSDIGVVTATGHKEDNLAMVKDRGDHCYVRKMRSASKLRVIRHENLRGNL
jgi:hypothetical protein